MEMTQLFNALDLQLQMFQAFWCRFFSERVFLMFHPSFERI